MEREMRTELAFWQKISYILGFDGEGDSAGDGQPDDQGSNGEPGTDPAGGGQTPDEPADNSGLKSALEKERANNKAMLKELKKLQKAEEDRTAKEKGEVQAATDKATKAAEQVAKLATKLRDGRVDQAIIEAATKLKFRDPEDALAQVSRSDIGVEQDEDDPAEIEVDKSSVEKAVKALAARKPHFLIADGANDVSGGKFNNSNKDKKGLDEETLKAKYSALR